MPWPLCMLLCNKCKMYSHTYAHHRHLSERTGRCDVGIPRGYALACAPMHRFHTQLAVQWPQCTGAHTSRAASSSAWRSCSATFASASCCAACACLSAASAALCRTWPLCQCHVSYAALGSGSSRGQGLSATTRHVSQDDHQTWPLTHSTRRKILVCSPQLGTVVVQRLLGYLRCCLGCHCRLAAHLPSIARSSLAVSVGCARASSSGG